MRIWTHDNPKHPLKDQARILVHTLDFARFLWLAKSKPRLAQDIHRVAGKNCTAR